MINKKGEIGSTIGWIAVTLIIIFIMFLYIISILWLVPKLEKEKTYSIISENRDLGLIFTKKFINFLDMPIKNDLTFYQYSILIEKDKVPLDDKEFIKEKIGDFLKDSLPNSQFADYSLSYYLYDSKKNSFEESRELSTDVINLVQVSEVPTHPTYFSDSFFISPSTKLVIRLGVE